MMCISLPNSLPDEQRLGELPPSLKRPLLSFLPLLLHLHLCLHLPGVAEQVLKLLSHHDAIQTAQRNSGASLLS